MSHKFVPMPGNKPKNPKDKICNRCLEKIGHENHFTDSTKSERAKDTVRTYDRARLHLALDAVMDAKPDGNFSPDEDDRMKALVAEAQKAVRKWKADREKLCVTCYEIGGNFRGSGYWKRIREIIKVGLE